MPELTLGDKKVDMLATVIFLDGAHDLIPFVVVRHDFETLQNVPCRYAHSYLTTNHIKIIQISNTTAIVPLSLRLMLAIGI